MSNHKFTLKERRFIDEYMIDFNATRAAIASGYSKNSARQIGSENLSKPYIKAEIERRLKEAELGPEQTRKMFGDIARGNVNNYMKKVVVEHTPRIRKHLSELISELKTEMSFEEEYAILADFTKEEFEEHTKAQDRRRKKVLRYELELKRNPNATRIVYGETELIEDTVLDLNAVAADKAGAKIKSFKMTKDGPQIELYNADNALDKIAQMHSMYKNNIGIEMNGNVDIDKWLEENNTGEVA